MVQNKKQGIFLSECDDERKKRAKAERRAEELAGQEISRYAARFQ